MNRPFRQLAIVGASTRAAAGSVYLSGRTAVTADLFADADLQGFCSVTRVENYPDAFLAWLDQTDCDGWLYTGALENYPDLVDAMAKVRPLLGNRGETLRQVRDPMLLQTTLARAGLPFPETCMAEGPAQGDWLAKTYQGSNGSGVSLVSDAIEGYLQRRIAGIPGAAIFAGGTLLGISQQLIGEAWTGADEFAYCGSLAPWQLPEAAQSQLEQVGRALFQEFHLQGLFGVDFIYDGNDAWPVEVNPRYTASVETLELVLGLQAIDWHLATCNRIDLPLLPTPKRRTSATVYGKAVWFAKQPLEISELASAWAFAQRDLSDIPTPGTMIDPGQPVLTVHAEAWTSAEVLATLQQRIFFLEKQFTRE